MTTNKSQEPIWTHSQSETTLRVAKHQALCEDSGFLRVWLYRYEWSRHRQRGYRKTVAEKTLQDSSVSLETYV